MIYIVPNELFFRQNAHNYEANGRKNHTNFKCCVHEPLLFGVDDLEILDLMMIPELHIFTGIVNRLVRVLNERWDNGHGDKFYQWCDANLILYHGFHSKVCVQSDHSTNLVFINEK